MKWYIRIAILVILGIFVFGSGIYLHELVHYNINDYAGCTDISISMNPFNGFYTIADCTSLSEETWNIVLLSHNINEVVGYTVLPFLMSGVYVFIGIGIWLKKK